jgi:hypothetical protein
MACLLVSVMGITAKIRVKVDMSWKVFQEAGITKQPTS